MAKWKHLLKIIIDSNDSIAKDKTVPVADRLKSESIKLDALAMLQDATVASITSSDPHTALKKMADKITAKDLAGKKRNFVLIDVREADEIAEDGGHKIEGAVNIPLGQLIRKARQGGLDDLKGKTICTYYNGGYRGNVGADELNKKGFTAVIIDGGYAAWKEEEKEKKQT